MSKATSPFRHGLSNSYGSAVMEVACASDDRLVSVGLDGYLCVWELDPSRKSSKAYIPAGRDNLEALAVSPDGTRAATGVNDVTVRDLSAPKKELLQFDPDPESGLVEGLAWSPDGTLIAAVSESITLWNAKNGKKLGRWPLGKEDELAAGFSRSVQFSPDGRFLLGSASTYGEGRTGGKSNGTLVTIVDPKKKKPICQKNVGHTNTAVWCRAGIVINPWNYIDGWACLDKGLTLLGAKDLSEKGKWPLPYEVSSIYPSPDGSFLVGVTKGYRILAIDSKGAVTKKISHANPDAPFNCAVSPSQKYLAVGSGGEVFRYDLRTGALAMGS